MRNLVKRASVVTGSLVLLTAVVAVLAPTASASTTAPYLKEGSAGIGVKCVQSAVNNSLIQAGKPGIAIDGDFGPATKSGVLYYQSAVGVAQDGIVGPLTGNDIMITIREYSLMPAEECYDNVPTSS